MDKIELIDASDEFSQIDVFGPIAESKLEKLGFSDLPGVNEIAYAHFLDQDVRMFHMHPGIGLGYRILLRRSDLDQFRDRLRGLGIPQINEHEYHLFHIEAGIPYAGAELSQAYTPLETRLETAVSSRKGCYTGQEVLARQITYDKITQRLCGLRLSAAVSPGMHLWSDGKQAGVVTSSGNSPRFGHIALAIVKRSFEEPGIVLHAGDEVAGYHPARVVGLPFDAEA